MLPRRIILALAASGCGLLLSAPVLAQRGARGGAQRGGRVQPPSPNHREGKQREIRTPIEEFETLPPAEQQKALNRLPASERQQLEQRLERFNALPPQQQQALRTLYNRLHQLPPQRQQAVRKAVSKLSQQSPERQQAIREELRNIAALPPDERQTRLSNPGFQSQFTKKEQAILRDMLPLLPDR